MFGVSAANPEAALSGIRSVIEVHKQATLWHDDP